MRVLALTNLYPNPMQPHRAPFNRQQFAALARRHEVRVIAPIAWTGELRGLTSRARTPGAPLPIWEYRHRVSDGMIIHHPRYLFTPKILRGWYGRFFADSVRPCFRDSVRDFRPDVVLGGWAYPDGWAALALAREVGLPVAVKVHGSDVLTVDEHPARRVRTAETLAGADAVIAVSRHLAEKAIEMGAAPERMHVVHSGVDSDLFHPAPRSAAREHLEILDTAPLIFFAGNLVAVKGLDVLIQALATLARSGQEYQCVIAGGGPLRGALLSDIAALGLGQHVRLIGARPLEELAKWYQAADLFVLPSRSEGLPNVLLEAAACGTPFIATRVGGIPEIAHPEALVPAGDAAALASRIKAFLGTKTRTDWSATIKPGSWDDSARALGEVLQGIAVASPARALRAA